MQQPLQNRLCGVPLLGALFSGPPVGIGILSAGIILAIMIIPFIAAVMRAMFDVTPTMLEGIRLAWAHRREVVYKAVPPYTKTGVIGGIMLGLAALGETMAVTFVIGNMNQLDSASLFEAPTASPRRWPTSSPRLAFGPAPASLIYLGGWCCSSSPSWCCCTVRMLLAQLQEGRGGT